MNIYPDITRLESVVSDLKAIMAAFDDREINADEASDQIQDLRGTLEDIVSDLDV